MNGDDQDNSDGAEDQNGREEFPAGFIERTAGKWIGELERAPQGAFEERLSFD